MRVGVILAAAFLLVPATSIPPASGGDPFSGGLNALPIEYSPCEWG